MSKRIEVGLPVRIVDYPGLVTSRHMIGHIGIVTRVKHFESFDLYLVSGTDHLPGAGWRECALEPIPPDADFQTFMDQCFRPVDLTIKQEEKLT